MLNSDTEMMLRDSLSMENCKTWRELEHVCRNIEARHRVEGITPTDLAAYENVKSQHAQRVARRVLA